MSKPKYSFEVNDDGDLVIGGIDGLITAKAYISLRRQLRGLHKAYDKLSVENEKLLTRNRELRARNADIYRQSYIPHCVSDLSAIFDVDSGVQVVHLEGRCPSCGNPVVGHFDEKGYVREEDCFCKACANVLVWDFRGLGRK